MEQDTEDLGQPNILVTLILSLLQGADVNGGDHEHQYKALQFSEIIYENEKFVKCLNLEL